jgi:pentatricopeptide repeat protein
MEEPPDIKRTVYPPGWPTIMTWKSRLADNVRPPPRAQLILAFGDLFFHKIKYGIPANITQAEEAYKLFRYLLEEHGEAEPGLTIVELEGARDALLIPPRDGDTEYHLKFSKELYAEICRRRKLDQEFSPEIEPAAAQAVEGSNTERPLADEDFRCYIQALTSYGASTEAAAEVHAYRDRPGGPTALSDDAKELWVAVLRGLASEGREEELLRQVKSAEEFGLPYGPEIREIMTVFYAQRKQVEESKAAFTRGRNEQLATAATYAELLRFSSNPSLGMSTKWLDSVFRTLVEANPSKEYWDLIFQWAIINKGEGVDGVARMINVMKKNNVNNPTCRPDIDTINGLLRTAVERNDFYLAERIMYLRGRLKLEPNTTTFALQMEYRMNAKDLEGARVVYKQLRRLETQQDEDMSVLNKYVRALCVAGRPFYKDIQEVMKDLEYRVDRVVTLEPETVVALCTTFLKNDKHYQVIDILAVHVFHYSAKQRDLVREAFVEYILDKDRNSTARAWDAYQLLKQFFADAPRASRVRVMHAFFRRRRSDMAIRVFSDMKQEQNSHPDLRPTVDDYAGIFIRLAHNADDEALQTIYNLLKLDTNVQVCTKLYNALMLGFSGSPTRRVQALGFWNELSRSKEGPSYASLDILFFACSRLPGAFETARAVWENLTRMEVEIPRAIFNSYCSALAGSGRVEDVRALIEGMEENMGYGPNMMT